MTAAESPQPALSNITVELRDGNTAALLQTTLTDGVGAYSFTGLANPAYIVSLAVDRTQGASPSQAVVSLTNGQNFTVRGVPVLLQLSHATPGTVILVTPNNPPATSLPMASAGSTYFSATAGSDGTAVIPVPPGSVYYYACWQSVAPGQYTRMSNQTVNSGTALNAGQAPLSILCGG